MTDTIRGMLTEDQFLSHMAAENDMTEDAFIEHVGVKGMKWGKRKASTPSAPDAPKTRSELRALNKASRKNDNVKAREQYNKEIAKQDVNIDRARKRQDSGQNAKNYKNAKAQYKTDKQIIGKREAAKAFQKVKDKNIADYEMASLAKSGKETTQAAIIIVAGAVIGAAIQVGLSKA